MRSVVLSNSEAYGKCPAWIYEHDVIPAEGPDPGQIDGIKVTACKLLAEQEVRLTIYFDVIVEVTYTTCVYHSACGGSMSLEEALRKA